MRKDFLPEDLNWLSSSRGVNGGLYLPISPGKRYLN